MEEGKITVIEHFITSLSFSYLMLIKKKLSFSYLIGMFTIFLFFLFKKFLCYIL